MMYTDKNGKQWEVVAIGKPSKLDHFVCIYGDVLTGNEPNQIYPIVRPIVPEWITPTDEHAKQRPMVEVRDKNTCEWLDAQLLGVVDSSMPYVVYFEQQKTTCSWRQCRMRNPEYVDNKGE